MLLFTCLRLQAVFVWTSGQLPSISVQFTLAAMQEKGEIVGMVKVDDMSLTLPTAHAAVDCRTNWTGLSTSVPAVGSVQLSSIQLAVDTNAISLSENVFPVELLTERISQHSFLAVGSLSGTIALTVPEGDLPDGQLPSPKLIFENSNVFVNTEAIIKIDNKLPDPFGEVLVLALGALENFDFTLQKYQLVPFEFPFDIDTVIKESRKVMQFADAAPNSQTTASFSTSLKRKVLQKIAGFWGSSSEKERTATLTVCYGILMC